MPFYKSRLVKRILVTHLCLFAFLLQLTLSTKASADIPECRKAGTKEYTRTFPKVQLASYSEKYTDERRPGDNSAVPEKYMEFCQSRQKAVEASLGKAREALEARLLFDARNFCDNSKNFISGNVKWSSPKFDFCISDLSNRSIGTTLHSAASNTGDLTITCKCPDKMMAKTCNAERAY